MPSVDGRECSWQTIKWPIPRLPPSPTTSGSFLLVLNTFDCQLTLPLPFAFTLRPWMGDGGASAGWGYLRYDFVGGIFADHVQDG